MEGHEEILACVLAAEWIYRACIFRRRSPLPLPPRPGLATISRRSLCALGCSGFGNLLSTFNALCSQHRW